ncbi:hypothetical protein V1517DRAFT_324527 [Lipomyces orientalis]|uniref:Uncharacterized protein n=1 Tax=Lipomyces orientalis TaxID=1233043 RepID=A0ACC3TN31_9ASCO
MANDSFELNWGRLQPASEFAIEPDRKTTAPNTEYNSVPRTSLLSLDTTNDYSYSTSMYGTASNYYSSAASSESISSVSSAGATPNFTSALADAGIDDDISRFESHPDIIKQESAPGRPWSPELEQLVDERMGSSRVWNGNLPAQPTESSPTSWAVPRVNLGANSRSSSMTSTTSTQTSGSSNLSEQPKGITVADYYTNYYHTNYYTGNGTDTTKLATATAAAASSSSSSFHGILDKNYTTNNEPSVDLPAGFGLDFDVGMSLERPPAPPENSTASASTSPMSAISPITALSTTMTEPTTPTTTTTTATSSSSSSLVAAPAQSRPNRRQGHNRNYRCRHCALVFSDAVSLKQHIALLPDATVSQRPYKCPEPSCDWHVIGFHRNNDCSRHYRQVHGVREFVCRWQGARECRTHRFVTAWLRNRHERTVHAGEIELLGLEPESGNDRTGARKRRKLPDP